MRKTRKAALAGAAALILTPGLLAAIPTASAFNTWNDRHLTYGVVNQRFWLDATAVQHNENAIVKGVARWNSAPGTPVSYTPTTVKANSRLDFYRVAKNDGNCSVARHFVNTTNVNTGPGGRPASNWWWGRVNNRPALKNTALCGPASHRKGIVAHEMGHVMGLAHHANSNRLMFTGIAGTTVNKPHKGDRNGINHLY